MKVEWAQNERDAHFDLLDVHENKLISLVMKSNSI